jgi:hypothetical protein
MNEPVKSAPLTLLMRDAAADVSSLLHSLFETDIELSVAHNTLKFGSATNIVFKGVSFVVSVGRHNQDLSILKSVFCNIDSKLILSGINISLGEHVAGGERVPAIMQALLGLAQKLGAALNAQGIVWHPANIVSGFSYFSEVVSDYLAGGAFPVLTLVNFKVDRLGIVHSNGLAFFSGQELQVANSAMDQTEIMRRVVRIVHDIAVNGPVTEVVKLDGIEKGEVLELLPLSDCGVLEMKVTFVSEV